MTSTPQVQAPGFLAALASVAKHGNLVVEFETEGDKLNVTVAAGGARSLFARGRPAALDAQLPAAIEKYARWLDSLSDYGAADAVEIRMPDSTAKKPAPPARKAKRAPAPRPKKRAAPPAPKKKPAPRRAPAKAAKPAAGAGLFTREDCIADYRTLKAKHGPKLTRRLFVDTARTGRRYEKIWANCWPDFVRDAEKGSPIATPPAVASAKPKAAPKAKAPAKAKPTKPAKPAAPAKSDKPKPWRVLNKAGKELGVTVLEKKVGDGYSCSAGTFTVVTVDAQKREVRVEPKASEAPPPAKPADPEKPAEDAAAASRRARGVYRINLSDGRSIGGTVSELEVGDLWGTGDRYQVTAIDHDKHEYTVRDREAPPPAAATDTAAATEETTA